VANKKESVTMAKRKTDLEQVRGILAQFSQDTILDAVRELTEEGDCRMSFKDFDDPGPEVKTGEDHRVAIEDMGYLERVIAEPNFLPVHFLEEGAVVQRAVARVVRTATGSGWGTGFMVSPSLFMTNNHVIPTESFAHSVEMQFNYQLDYRGNPQTVDVYSPDPDDVFYTNSPLDFTLVKLNPHCRYVFDYPWRSARDPEVEEEIWDGGLEYTPNPFGPGSRLPSRMSMARFPIDRARIRRRVRRICTPAGQVWGYLQLIDGISYAGPSGDQPGQHVNVIQHPRGRRKEVSLQRNNITNIYANRVRYTSDTEPGSSGSPVFNNQWDLICIHHAAGEWDPANEEWVSNEGMRMDKIVDDLRSHYAGSTTGDRILAELGIA
jgi:endonuclease G